MNNTESTIQYSLGIDISKKDFHAAILRHEDRKIIAEKSFPNTATGNKEHINWLVKHCGKAMAIHACLEATGTYGDSVVIHLHTHLSKVSLVNPRAIKNFGAMQLRRDKSDKADARLIAQYCNKEQPSAWHPPSEAQAQTKALARRLSQLKCDLIRENNRLEATNDKAAKADIKDSIKALTKRITKLEKQLEELIQNNPENKQTLELITSINGIGKKSGTQIISELPELTNFPTGRALAAYAGVTPRHFQTGTSGKTRTPMSKAGNSSRSAPILFWKLITLPVFPAMSAMRFNPICKEFAARLKAQGKPQIVIIGAIMNTRYAHKMF